ncbi:MAG: hypothetical protein A2035_01260 [Nitrospirae bacterium GWA2_42_11]|nr:MAG: hypothetical protein A2035_01260 [Nitrospirae bacterium GWA2_42_11]
MEIKTFGERGIFLALITLFIAGTLIASGCSGGGGGTGSTDVTGGDTTDSDTTTDGDTVAKATLSGTLLNSSSSSGNSLFKRLKKSAAATSLPVSGATVLCFDTDSVSTAATGNSNTDSSGIWNMDVDPGNYVCFGIYIDLASLTIKTTRMDDIVATAGEAVEIPAATVESDTTSPSIVSVLSDNVADTSLSDGDPDPLYEASDILPSQAISVIFSEAMNTSTMQPGTGVVLKDSSGTVVETTAAFNGTGTEFRYTPSTSLTPASTYTLYITNKAKDLSNNGINDPDSDGVVALARLTVTENVDAFSYLSSSPKNDATDVNVYKDISVTFNRPVDFVTFKDNTIITPAISGRFESSGDGVSLLHSTPLEANTTYTMTLGADVADLGANTLVTPVIITFTTGAGIDSDSISGFDPGGGTTEDLLHIVANVTKIQLAADNQDIVSFASYFAPTFTMKERECHFDSGGDTTMSGDMKLQKVAAMEGPGQEICETSTINLDDFLDQMKKDFVEQRNMAKGFGQTQRMLLTNVNTNGKLSVEHFNSAFDADRNPVGVSLLVGWPNRIPGVDFVDSEIEVSDPWAPGGIRMEHVNYRLKGACRELADQSEEPGTGEVKATFHRWNNTLMRDEMVTQICPVYDGDADSTNSWATDDEIYPVAWTKGPRNAWEDNDGDCLNGGFACHNEDGIISLKDTDSNGSKDKAVRYYEDPNTHMWVEQDITSQLQAAGGLTVAAAMQVAAAAANEWDIEGVDNDGDSRMNYFNQVDCLQGCWLDRRNNEDWPNGMDDDGDCDSEPKDGIDDRPASVCIDEDNDGMGANPWPQDGNNDNTNDPMVWSDWNLANKADITSNDEFWAQTFLSNDVTLRASGTDQWRDDDGNAYYEVKGPKGWPYPYAAGKDSKPWSGDEFDQYSGSGTSLDDHAFAWADVSILGKVYFRNDDKSTGSFIDADRNVYLDLNAAGITVEGGRITAVTLGTTTAPRVPTANKDAAMFRWNNNGQLSNNNGAMIDWKFVHPLMDHVDYNADGDNNVNSTDSSVKLRRVPHDRVTGGVMSEAEYLGYGWETWRVSNDYQLIDSTNCPTADSSGCSTWDVEAEWSRMEGDDDGDGQFNEDGLYSDYFDSSDGSLNSCESSSDYPCMKQDSTTGQLTLYKEDGSTTTSFDISDGVDNDWDGEVDEEEPFDDDWDGNSDEDPIGDPNDSDNNGDTTAPYDDDDDGRKDEDPVSYERDRINDHTQWARVYQETTDAVVEMFYLETNTELLVNDLVIDETGTKATGIVDIIDTEKWTPNNPWGDDFNGDGVPDNENRWTETMVFNLEKISSKWLVSSIQAVDSLEDYAEQLANDEIKQFGGNIARIKMISPVGDPLTGPSTNQTTTPTFSWDDSEVSVAIGSYLIHIEEITETMVTSGGEPKSVMMLVIGSSEVTTDSVTGVRSFKLGSGGTDMTADILAAFADDPYFPFETAITALENGKAYSWGVIAFSQTTLDFTSGKPEPLADSFEPMMFATGDLPTYFTSKSTTSNTVAKAKMGGKEYNTIPSNIAPSLYDKASDSGSRNHNMPSSNDPRQRH